MKDTNLSANFQLRTNVIPQLTGMSRYHHVRRNSPKPDVLLVEFPDVIRLVSEEDGVCGGLERGMHHRKRRRQFIGARSAYAVRFFTLLGARVLCMQGLFGRHNDRLVDFLVTPGNRHGPTIPEIRNRTLEHLKGTPPADDCSVLKVSLCQAESPKSPLTCDQ